MESLFLNFIILFSVVIFKEKGNIKKKNNNFRDENAVSNIDS